MNICLKEISGGCGGHEVGNSVELQDSCRSTRAHPTDPLSIGETIAVHRIEDILPDPLALVYTLCAIIEELIGIVTESGSESQSQGMTTIRRAGVNAYTSSP